MKFTRLIILSMLICGLWTNSALSAFPQVSCGVAAFKHGTATSTSTAHVGDILDYVINVSVPSNGLDIHNGTVTLTLPNGNSVTVATGVSLAANNSLLFPASWPPVPANQQYTVNVADIGTHGATAHHILAKSECDATASDETEVTGTGQNPVLIIEPNVCVTKTVTPTTSAPGGQVTFHIKVCNCGDTTLTRDSVIDTILGVKTSSFPTSLTAGQCSSIIDFPYTIPLDADANNPLCNIVTAKYEDILGLQVQDDANACVTLEKPGIDVKKTCDAYSKVGDTINYEVKIKNTGNANLTIDSVVDNKADNPIVFSSCNPLAPGATCTLDYSHLVVAGDDSNQPGAKVTNTVTVTAHLTDVPAVTVSQQATCDTILVHPSFTASKVCEPTTVTGPTAQYRIIITNNGDVPLLIHVVDPGVTPAIPDQQLSNVPPLNVINQLVTKPVPAGATEVCNDNMHVLATLPASYGLGNSYTFDSGPICCQVPGGQEGCTLGYWKNNTPCWCGSYLPGQKLNTVFDFSAQGIPPTVVALGNKTLLQALAFPGGSTVAGKAQNMLRQAVAALLNACSENVDFPLNTTAVIDKVNDALINTFKLGTVQSEFSTDNSLGCPLNADEARCSCCRNK